MNHGVITTKGWKRKADAGGTGRNCLLVNHEIQHVAALSVTILRILYNLELGHLDFVCFLILILDIP